MAFDWQTSFNLFYESEGGGAERRDKGSNSERSDLRFEAWKPIFVKKYIGVFMINL